MQLIVKFQRGLGGANITKKIAKNLMKKVELGRKISKIIREILKELEVGTKRRR